MGCKGNGQQTARRLCRKRQKNKKERRSRKDLLKIRHRLDVSDGGLMHNPLAIIRPPNTGLNYRLPIQLLKPLLTEFHAYSPPKNAFKPESVFLRRTQRESRQKQRRYAKHRQQGMSSQSPLNV